MLAIVRSAWPWSRLTSSGSPTRYTWVCHSARSRPPPPSSSPIAAGYRSWASRPGSPTTSGACGSRTGDDAGGPGRPGRRHPPDDHRHRAGPLLAVARDGVPDCARLRRAARGRVPVRRRPAMTVPQGNTSTAVNGLDSHRAGSSDRSGSAIGRPSRCPAVALGLRAATPERWGMFRLRTIGRKSGAKRAAILGYIDDGENLVTLAANAMAPERAGLVAEPRGPAGSDGRSARQHETSPGARCARRRAGTAVGALGHPGPRSRPARGCARDRDSGRGPRTGACAGARRLTRVRRASTGPTPLPIGRECE